VRLTRRHFLAGSAAGVATFALGGRRNVFASPPGSGKFLVVITLDGGNDGLNTITPNHLTPYHERRPTLRIENPLPLDGNYGIHPALPGLRETWQAGELHVVQKVGYPNPNLSHFTSADIYAFGVRDPTQGDGRGWLGRLADTYTTDPLGVVAVGTGGRPDFAAHHQSSLVLRDVKGFKIDHDPEPQFIPDHILRVEHNRRLLEREALPGDAPGSTAYKAAREAHELVERVQAETAGWTDPGIYPNTPLAGRLKTIANLESANFGTKVYYTAQGGYDTHANQQGRHQKLLTELDGALRAFREDMQRTGRWNECAVLITTEFGRRTEENGSDGTDHGAANAFMVAGGAVNGGMTGELTESDLLTDQPQMRYDFRELHSHLIERHLGLDPAPVFPEPFQTTGELDLVA
jgi:uncharacterized protein (DUF1501 family)